MVFVVYLKWFGALERGTGEFVFSGAWLSFVYSLSVPSYTSKRRVSISKFIFFGTENAWIVYHPFFMHVLHTYAKNTTTIVLNYNFWTFMNVFNSILFKKSLFFKFYWKFINFNLILYFDAPNIPAFNPDPHEELREGHAELMNSLKGLIDIQSEDKDEDNIIIFRSEIALLGAFLDPRSKNSYLSRFFENLNQKYEFKVVF